MELIYQLLIIYSMEFILGFICFYTTYKYKLFDGVGGVVAVAAAAAALAAVPLVGAVILAAAGITGIAGGVVAAAGIAGITGGVVAAAGISNKKKVNERKKGKGARMKHIILNIKNAKKLFPKEYTKVRIEDFIARMPKGHKSKNFNKMNTAYEQLFENAKGHSEYIASRKGTRIKFINISED